MIVIAVAVLLTGLLLPALNKLRENVNTVVCQSNQRQLAIGIGMFAHDNNGNLPGSIHLRSESWRPQELMAARTPESPQGWDGLGVLYQKEYCGAFECFYCPNHRGAHPASRYADLWGRTAPELIYTNFHYFGNREWDSQQPRFYQRLNTLVLLSDGLRTSMDINHRFGMNVAYGDMSVQWRTDLVSVFDFLPESESDVAQGAKERYEGIWEGLQRLLSPDGP